MPAERSRGKRNKPPRQPAVRYTEQEALFDWRCLRRLLARQPVRLVLLSTSRDHWCGLEVKAGRRWRTAISWAPDSQAQVSGLAKMLGLGLTYEGRARDSHFTRRRVFARGRRRRDDA